MKSWESCLVGAKALADERRLPADQALQQDQLGVCVVDHRGAHDHLRRARRHDVARLVVVRGAHGLARGGIAGRLQRRLAVAGADVPALRLRLHVPPRAPYSHHPPPCPKASGTRGTSRAPLRRFLLESIYPATETGISASLGQECSNCQPCCASSRRRNACSSSEDGVATHVAGNCIRKLDATTTHSPIAETAPSAILRPCSHNAPSFRYTGTPNWRYAATAGARPHGSQRRRLPGARRRGAISANG